MDEHNPDRPVELTPEEAQRWPAICKLLRTVAGDHGFKLPRKLRPDHLDGEDVANLTEIINDAKGRAPEHANILNHVLRIIQS